MEFRNLAYILIVNMASMARSTITTDDKLGELQFQLNSIKQDLILCGCGQEAKTTKLEDTHVAFTVYASNDMRGLGRYATIKFDSIETNIGQAYTPSTGLFTCPYTGQYYFTHSIMTLYQSYVETEIVLEGHSKAKVYAKATNNTYIQGSNSVILHCNADDHVWVRIIESRGSSFHGDRYSQFSGYLMWKD